MNETGSFQHTWLFALLWTNAALAVVDGIVILAGPPQGAHSIVHTLAFTFVYANATSMLALLVLGWLLPRLQLRGFAQGATALAGIVLFTCLACLAAQAVLSAAGMAAAERFRAEYLGTLKIALPLALVFGLGAMTHASLLTRARTAEQALHVKEMAEERSRKLEAEARLRSLESWIHPHFLFNTLNSISALIPVDAGGAEKMVGRLATLLRASLDSSGRSLIPLWQEMAMVESYVEIERVRLGARLRGRMEIPAEMEEAKVPPLSIQTLVENAVRHGIGPLPEGGEFRVSARADADGSLRVEVRDSGPGFDVSGIRSGHGLDKLVQRLDALFGEQARLQISPQAEGCLVEMVLPRV